MSKRFFSCTGSKERVIYEPFFDSAGARKLRVAGIQNTDEFIQSFAESTDINLILARFAAGDSKALNARPCFYGDFTAAPKTLAEFLNVQNKANELFNSLPLSVRQSFDNDPNKFFVGYGTPEWTEKIKPFVKDGAVNEP